MLYIAEVKRQSKGFISGSKTFLKLLACQRNDQTWSAVPGEELLDVEEHSTLGEGALVMVNLSNNRQIQGQPEPAATRLVSVLQNFSRALEKSKKQEEEIEQWKESLTYQAQELSRREAELEMTREQIELKEEEYAKAEQEHEALERERTELETVRAQIEAAQSRLAQSEGRFLDPKRAQQIRQLYEQLAQVTPSEAPGKAIEEAKGAIADQKRELERTREQLASRQSQWQQKKQLAEEQQQQLRALETELGRLRGTALQSGQQLSVCETALETKQEAARSLIAQLRARAKLQDMVSRIATSSSRIRIGQLVNRQAIENMPLSELEKTIADLERDLAKVVPFVSDQEAELQSQRQSVEELQAQLQTVSEHERASVERELEEEQDRFRFLEETLIGQRRNLKVREDILYQHQRIWRQRRGDADAATEEEKIDFGPLYNEVEEQKNNCEAELQIREEEIEQLQQQIDKLRQQRDRADREIAQKETQLATLRTTREQTLALASALEAEIGLTQTTVEGSEGAIQSLSAAIAVFDGGGETSRALLEQVRQVLAELLPAS